MLLRSVWCYQLCGVRARGRRQPAQVKKRIESLLEREYLERDEETPSIYHYVA